MAASTTTTALVSANPYMDFGRAVALFAKPQGSFSGISDKAFVDEAALLGANVTVYPFAYIGPRAVIGDGCVIFSGCYIGEDCVLDGVFDSVPAG